MLITKPLGKNYNKHLDNDGRLVVDVAEPLDELFGGIDNLNGYMDEYILGGGRYSLSDISYQVVGSIPPIPSTYIGGEVILRVNADVDDMQK